MDKAGKAVALEAYKKVFADAGVIVVTQYSGLTVTQLTDLRVKLKGEGANLKVIKNRLAKIALDGKGGDAAANMFVGPVAIAFSPDPVAASKVVAEFAKGNEQDHRPHPGSGDQDRWRRGCAGGSARSRHWRLRQQGRRLRPSAQRDTPSHTPELKENLKCRNLIKSSKTCPR